MKNLHPSERLSFMQNSHFSLSNSIFENFCPINTNVIDHGSTRYEHESTYLRNTSYILEVLFLIDKAFEKILGYKKHLYLLNYESLIFFMDKIVEIDFDYKKNIELYLESLSVLGLIYHFTVAKKFGYKSPKIMQFRLNGWGRDFCLNYSNIKIAQISIDKVEKIIDDNQDDFNELLKLCNSSERPLNIDKIHAYNKKLPFSIVS